MTTGLDRALTGMALGRLALGAASRLSPRATAGPLGAAGRMTPELDYMTRVFGARAIALGLGFLSARGPDRDRWQRLAFGVDVSDTLAGLAQLRRGEGDAGMGVALTALTGTYALLGGAKVLRDLRR